jgi:ADP-heptose:LPS heptosyltransferase
LPSPNRDKARLSLLRLAAAAAPTRQRPSKTEPRRVLLLRPDHIGDVLLTAPAIALLRASLPTTHLTYVVGPWSAEAARHGPTVDNLRTLVYPGFTRRPNANILAPYAVLLRVAAQLRRERYDMAVVFRRDHWWGALLALAAGIPVRIGQTYSDTPEMTVLLTDFRSAQPREHVTLRALALARFALHRCGAEPAESVAVPSFRLSESARAAAIAFWASHELVGHTVVGVQPSAGAPLKRWPVERWASLADKLLARGLTVLLIGDPNDRPLLSAIQARISYDAPIPVACGQSLSVSAALYERCALLVGPDGGAAHLAAAVGTPTVRLYGPAPSDVFGPWPPREDQRVLMTDALSCVPCGHLAAPPCGAITLPACLLALGVDDVLNAVEQQLARG